jgi:predicted metal-binding protein
VRSNEELFGELVHTALRCGASRAKVIPAKDIVIDKRVRLKCVAPLCDNYGNHLLCPPAVQSVDEFREIVSLYKSAILVQLDAAYDSTDKPGLRLSDRAKSGRDEAVGHRSELRLHHIINEVEREAFKSGRYLAAGLIASECSLCKSCVGRKSGRSCRHPFEARPSMQALGIDVISTCRKARIPVRLSSSDRVRWTGLVLLE